MILLDDIEFPIIVNGVLYSTQRRMSSIWKAFAMDDIGSLKIYENKIQFSGNKKEFNIINIKRIFTTKQNPSYGTHFIGAIISIACILFMFMYLHSVFGYFLPFFTGIIILFFLAIIILFPVSLFLSRSDWIGILYRNNGMTRTAFFSEGELPKDSVLRGEDYPKKSSSLFKTLKLVEITKEENSD
jgi:hypothetical protein